MNGPPGGHRRDPNRHIAATTPAKPSPMPAYRATIRKTLGSDKSKCQTSIVPVKGGPLRSWQIANPG